MLTQPHTALLFVFCLLLGAIFLKLIATKEGTTGKHGGYRTRSLLTANEVEFFGRLRAALPDHYIFPQVAMSALIEPKASGKKRITDFRRISQKRVDFAVCDSALKLLVIVELDDRTHNAARDAIRDDYVSSAGVRTLRYPSSKRPSVEILRAAIAPVSSSRDAPFVRPTPKNAPSEKVAFATDSSTSTGTPASNNSPN